MCGSHHVNKNIRIVKNRYYINDGVSFLGGGSNYIETREQKKNLSSSCYAVVEQVESVLLKCHVWLI